MSVEHEGGRHDGAPQGGHSRRDVLGLAARLGRFCTLGAIEDVLYGQSDHRLRMWGVAIGIAIIGSLAWGYVTLA